ncbi:MAG: hypothetical protein IPK82_21005 [Polyangiaceae bacterium]|nr:hypothetical protein [Polyangiaceae bacterium]
MRYGIKPTALVEHLALFTDQVPVPMVDTLFAMLQARSIMAAVKLRVFEAMQGPGVHTVQSVAAQLSLDAPSLELLMRVLAAAGYVASKGEGYVLTHLSRKWLLSGSKTDVSATVKLCYEEINMLGNLETLIQTGKGIDFHGSIVDSEVWKTYQQSMFEIARGAAPFLTRLLPVPPGARTLLDIAGSHGYLGAAICRKHPSLRSTVIDLPSALPHARALAVQAGITDLVDHREGNLLEGIFPGPNDVVLLANIVHHFGESQIIEILTRALRAVRKGGVLAIWDAKRQLSSSPDLGADGLALWFRLTSESRIYEEADYVRFMRAAGARDVQMKKHLLAPLMVLVHGTQG